MAAVDFGTAFVWGVGATVAAEVAVQSFSWNSEFANKGQVEDESGNVVNRRRDDRTQTATIALKYQTGYTPAVIGTTITYGGTEFEIEKVVREEKNKEHRILTYELLTSEDVSLA